MNSKLNVGIVGYGPFGQGIGGILKSLPDVRVLGVFNRGEERRRQAAADGFQVFADYGEMLRAPGLHAVFIVTANSVHPEQCIAAAATGKHIFCEKPLALDLASYDAVLDACRRAAVITHLDFTMRFGSGTRALLDVVHSGRLGNLLTLWVRRCRGFGLWAAGKRHPDIAHPEVSGGWNIHHNVHGTDLLLHLARQKVVEVYCAQRKSSADTPCEEIILSLVTFADGAAGFVGDSTSILREDYVGVIGNQGTAVLQRDGQLVVRMEDGTETIEQVPPQKGLAASCQSFVDACLGRTPANIPFEEGRHGMEVLLAMNTSAVERRIVKLRE